MTEANQKIDHFESADELDLMLSERFIALDPKGYFLIKIDEENAKLVLEYYRNIIDDEGVAHDDESGEVLVCNDDKHSRKPAAVYSGNSAKELGIEITEGEGPHPISRLDHALYIGRELQKAELCMRNGLNYIQD